MFLIKDVTLAYGAKVLFNEISETIGPRDRIALVGSNGSGKTTLLRLLMGKKTRIQAQLKSQIMQPLGIFHRMESQQKMDP